MQVPFTLIVPTAYGQMIVNRYDINQAGALITSGRSCNHNEIDLLRQVLAVCGTNLVVLDIGANFGTYTLGLVSAIGEHGIIHAFEPQRIICNMLAGSVAINSLTNVHCHCCAIGDSEGRIEVPQFDYAQPLNFGSIEFGPEQREVLSQPRGHDAKSVEFVPLRTIDGFEFQNVDLIKLDVEGMEDAALRGARKTIERCRPVLYVEFLKSDKQSLGEYITNLGYRLQEISDNFLCIPSEMDVSIHVK